MADPVTMAAAAAATAKSASSIMGGYSRASEMKQEASNYEAKARTMDLQQKQENTSRANELQSALETITWLQAARNVGFDSPTSAAIEKATAKKAATGMLISNAGYSGEKDAAKRSATGLRKGARRAIIAGYVNSVPSLMDAGSALGAPTGGA